ncbi:MAG: DUF2726 domain-containing protein [Burkholderiales bacterium]|jgi:hypothetical protein|nr:DUF2726 domain-containing protein [Burkholderiales bacterium]MBP7519010.1 DUF2726 domain-containing protein [Leptothrix sp. (in: b-proteobacteria)]HQY08724.1 DUF2726 domain-containing protein [Burkholderiaceae bacterium]
MDFAFLHEGEVRLLLAAGVVAFVIWLWRRRMPGQRSQASTARPRALDAVDTVIGWPPEATRVLTMRHREALELLRKALPNHVVLAQVPLSHFIKVPTRHSYMEWLRRVGHVCIDLMVCDEASNVIAVIELRQSDRVLSERARKRHARVERVLKAAGTPLHLWNESMLPDIQAVCKAFILTPQSDGPATLPLQDGPDRRAVGLEPPGASWFDELHSTRPNALDSGPVEGAEGAGSSADLSLPPVHRPMAQLRPVPDR